MSRFRLPRSRLGRLTVLAALVASAVLAPASATQAEELPGFPTCCNEQK